MVLVDLQEQLHAAWATVATSSVFFNSEVRATVLKNLDTDKKRIERLAGELLDQVRAGALPFSNWVSIATTTHEDIAYQVGLTGEWSLTGVLADALAATYDDVKTGTTETLQSVGGGAGVGAIAGFLLVLLLAWKFK